MRPATARKRRRVRLVERRKIWVFGAVAVAAIAGFGVLGTHPLVAGERDDRRVSRTVVVLQQIGDLRTALAAWQVYIQPHFADFSAAPAKIQPQELAKGAVLAQTQSDGASALVASLKGQGAAADAQLLEKVNVRYTASIVKFAQLDGGAPSGTILSTIAAESAAFAQMYTITSTAADHLRTQNRLNLQAAIDNLQSSRSTFLVADGVLAVLAVVGAGVFGQRARRRERADRTRSERQAFESTFQDALEMAKTEADAYSVMTDALTETVPRLQVEMLVADSSRAHFHQTLDTRTDADASARSGCGVVSPLDCPATRRSHALVFPSSGALNACPYLKERPTGALSATCIPISITGQTSGVVHATAAAGLPPTETETHYLETTSRLAAERIAMLRAFEKSESQARTDPLTGLWNRRSFENRLHDLSRDDVEYTLAYGDLDHFKVLNDTHGHEAGDQALRLFARVLRDSIRPDDITARYGGEEFVIVLPNCPLDTATRVLERLRERLALTLGAGRVPAFTVSFGLASSTDGDTIDEVVATADRALLAAKRNGRNRTVRASDLDMSLPVSPQPATQNN